MSICVANLESGRPVLVMWPGSGKFRGGWQLHLEPDSQGVYRPQEDQL